MLIRRACNGEDKSSVSRLEAGGGTDHDVAQLVGASDHNGVLHVRGVLGPEKGQRVFNLARRDPRPVQVAEQLSVGLRRRPDLRTNPDIA